MPDLLAKILTIQREIIATPIIKKSNTFNYSIHDSEMIYDSAPLQHKAVSCARLYFFGNRVQSKNTPGSHSAVFGTNVVNMSVGNQANRIKINVGRSI